MGWINLYDHQRKALEKMHDGCILCGDVGSGKSRTALAYYYISQGGSIDSDQYLLMDNPCDLIIITTARKRDTFEWEKEMMSFYICKDKDATGFYSHNVTIDSWNNIKKYENVTGAFFIFDEQRVVGSGAWVKAFLKITKPEAGNRWILLSATPGDTWSDYIPVMVANGFYKNRTAFEREHIIWNPYVKFRSVQKYVNQKKLRTIRDYILVDMPMERKTVRHKLEAQCNYNAILYRKVMRERWNPYEKKPIENVSELCYVLRRIVNSDPSRLEALGNIIPANDRAIIFYNFDYELEILKNALRNFTVAEWNGHKHEPIPDTKYWVYLVQYTAGAEGWNCTSCNTIIFYSQNYSYKVMQQASGRIDRLNTPYKDLFYHHFTSKAPIDLAIRKALLSKRNFNESRFVK